MLRLAGFSAGRSVCARGGWSAGQSESIAAFCVRIMTGARFYRNVLRSVHAYRAFLSECLAFGSRLSHVSIGMSCVRFTPAVCRKAPNRTACAALRSYSAVGRDRHSCVLAALFGYLPLWVHFGFGYLFVAISTGYRDAGNEERGWRQGASGSLRNRIGLVSLSAESTLGLRAPNLRQRVFDSLDSLHAAAGLP